MASLSGPLFPSCAKAERVHSPHRDWGTAPGGSAPSNLGRPCGQGWAEAPARPPLSPAPLPPPSLPEVGLRGPPEHRGLDGASVQPSCRGPEARFRGSGSGSRAPALRTCLWEHSAHAVPAGGQFASSRGQAGPGRRHSPGRTPRGCAGWRCGVVGRHRAPSGLCAPALCSGLGPACSQCPPELGRPHLPEAPAGPDTGEGACRTLGRRGPARHRGEQRRPASAGPALPLVLRGTGLEGRLSGPS